MPMVPFWPVIEHPDVPDAFITEDPEVLLKEGRFNKVPYVTGIVEDEGVSLQASCKTNTKHYTFYILSILDIAQKRNF
jgi:Carboxylesterase family